MGSCRDIPTESLNRATSLKNLYVEFAGIDGNLLAKKGWYLPANHSAKEIKHRCEKCHSEHHGIFYGKRTDAPMTLTPGLNEGDLYERFDHVHGMSCTVCHTLPFQQQNVSSDRIPATRLSLHSGNTLSGLAIYNDSAARLRRQVCLGEIIRKSPYQEELMRQSQSALEILAALQKEGKDLGGIQDLPPQQQARALAYLGLLHFVGTDASPVPVAENNGNTAPQPQDSPKPGSIAWASLLTLLGLVALAGHLSVRKILNKKTMAALMIDSDTKKTTRQTEQLKANPQQLLERRVEELLRVEAPHYDIMPHDVQIMLREQVLGAWNIKELRDGKSAIDAEFVRRHLKDFTIEGRHIEFRDYDERLRRRRDFLRRK